MKTSFKNLIPPLLKEEYDLLEESILKEGCREALSVWRDVLVDGHNRKEICDKHNIAYDSKQIEFDSEEEAKIWIIKNQLGRRNISAFARAELALQMEPLLRVKGLENKSLGGREKEVLTNLSKLNTRETLAKEANISEGTIHKVKKIISEGTPEQIHEVRSGEKSIHGVYTQIKKPHISQATGNNEWYTPKLYIDAVHRVMGGIDLDPASSKQANETVGASSYFTIENDGLKQHWEGRVFMNPPYSSDLISKFCAKLVNHFKKGDIPEAIVLVNNATETGWFQDLMTAAETVVFTHKRIQFNTVDGKRGTPLQAQAFLYIGINSQNFIREFQAFGWICNECRTNL